MAYSAITGGTNPYNADGYTGTAGRTYLDNTNKVTGNGVLTSFAVRVISGYNVTGLKAGTFSGSGISWSMRDYESLGDCSYTGSNQVYTGKNCACSTDDCVGYVVTAGRLEMIYSDGTRLYRDEDTFHSGAHNYSNDTGTLLLYATGVTVPDAPTSVSATDNLTDKVTITWTPGTGETGGHRVYRDGVDISGVVAHGTSSYDDTTAVVGTTYSYTVKAINDAGLSAASSADNGIRVSSFVPRIMIF